MIDVIESFDGTIKIYNSKIAKKINWQKIGKVATNVGKIAKEAFKQIKHLPKQEIFELCEGLWQTGYLEESVVACVWAESLHKQYEPADFKIFERS